MNSEKLNIKTADNSDKRAWDHYVLNHPMGIAYQLFAWKEAVEQAYGFNGCYLIAEKNNQIKGVLPLVHVNPPFMSGQLISLPYCDAGGPLADSSEIARKLIIKAMHIAENIGVKNLTIRSIREFAGIDPDLTKNKKKARMILKLPENSDKLLASLKAKVRSQAKKPVRDGLTVQADGQKLLCEFYTLFAENMRDLGSPVHSFKWFKNILKAYKNRSHLFLVRMPDKTPAAGGIILCHSNMVSVPWASSLRRLNKSNPNMLLYWNFLKFASDNGYDKFDFGRSTPNEGTFRFKKQWGAVPEYLHWAEFNSSMCKARQNHRIDIKNQNKTKGIELIPKQTINLSDSSNVRQFAEAVVMKMPVSISKVFGNITRKYITL